MIKYFKELENQNDNYINLIEWDHTPNDYPINKEISPDYWRKISFLMNRIKEYDLLYDNNSKTVYYSLDEQDEDTQISLEFEYSLYMNYYFNFHPNDKMMYGITKEGINKIDELKNRFKSNYKGNSFKDDFFKYFINITNYMSCNLILSKDSLRVFLKTAMNMAKYQNKLTPYDEMIFNDVIKYLRECELIIPTELYKEVKMDLPNSWYITPHNHLYNTLGPNGHKEANLIYPFYYDILTNENFSSGKGLLKRIRTILKDGAIEKKDFDDYTHLIYDFPSVFSEEYYDLPNDKKLAYKCFYRKSYNPKIVNLIVGILSAQASLYEFFYYLKNTSNDYQADINYLKQFSLDEILVRCCGFHKIISPVDKMISTSDVNYQEDFAEYIKQGWHIDFVKPIVLNSSGRLEELTDDFMNIRNFMRD